MERRFTSGDAEAAKPGVKEALADKIAMTIIFQAHLQILVSPTARSDEAGVSYRIGCGNGIRLGNYHIRDKPIVMVQLGWPNHTEVNSGRTAPFAKGGPVC